MTEFLEHLVTAHVARTWIPVADKIQAIRDWPTSRCLRDVRAFFDIATYYRRFVRNFATIAEPLTRLTRKHTPFRWSDEADLAFKRLIVLKIFSILAATSPTSLILKLTYEQD